MTGAEAIAECLKTQGIEAVFGIRGLHITPLASAAKERGIRFIEVRHEQSAAFMADAYARVTGGVGVVMVATGAGSACTMVGIQEAYGSSSPVMLIASQIEQKHLQKGWGDLHEVKNHLFQVLTGEDPEFQLPLRFLTAAVRHRETHDPRVLLELPEEERRLLGLLLNEPSGQEIEASFHGGARPNKRHLHRRRKRKTRTPH